MATVKQIEKLVRDGKPGDFGAGNGLFLKIAAGGGASWYCRFTLNGKRQKLGLGAWPAVSLADARSKAADAAKQVAAGLSPAKPKTITKTFDQLAADYIEAQRPAWRNPKSAQQWANSLTNYASPVIGKKLPGDITTEDLLRILKPLWQSKTETATRVRGRIELILDSAKALGLREGDNPARWRGHLDKLLPAVEKVAKVRNHPALPFTRMAEFWQALTNHADLSASAVKFTVLTACRTGEVLGAKWSEIDGNVWTIPAERMKAGKAHRVPLSSTALELLASLPRENDYLFPGARQGRPLSAMAMLMKIRGMDEHTKWRDASGAVIVPHGFRSTFRDWAAETTPFANIVCEMALAHTVKGVEGDYRRGDLLDKRRELMEAWAGYVTQPAADNVVQLRGRA